MYSQNLAYFYIWTNYELVNIVREIIFLLHFRHVPSTSARLLALLHCSLAYATS